MSKPIQQLEDYIEGAGCTCYASNMSDCACMDVDWTPKEVYLLRKEAVEKDKRIAELEQALQERTEYMNKLSDDIFKDINRVWVLDGFVDQVAKVDCESYSDIFLLKDTALRLKTGRDYTIDCK